MKALAIPRKRLVSIIGGSAGNLVEWYDWFAYAAFAIYFAPVFFPKADPTAQLLSTAAIFAVGFVMRPIGAWVMGRFADTRGRKAGLSLSVALMFSGSMLIAVAPTYAAAGLLGPTTLLVARMLQGLSLGGEYGASATYLSEMAPKDHRGFWASFQYMTLIGGQLCAIFVAVILQAFLTEAELTAWGWRIPFVIGAVLALAVYLLRRNLAETPSFENQAVDRPVSTAKLLWKEHRRESILVGMLSAGGGLAAYTYTSYMQKYLFNTVGFDKATATYIVAVALIWFTLMQPVFGALADRFGRKPMLLLFGIGGALVAAPTFLTLETVSSPVVATLLILIPLTFQAGYTANNALVKAELFPAHIRGLGVALPYAVGNAIFGGTVEMVALALKGAGVEWLFYFYVAAVIGMAGIATLLLPETKERSLIVED
ncbi:MULTISPECIES: MFS transporter [unclassified Sphingopyxis]|jgi:MHS family alpha-ketoglutarate permease-like MFS transporter|uniref:MFS transporter n=1 Tax=unclassified Sphingopyxis TaxID=2614943 RepID=UPI00073059B2|nr:MULTISPECIES: MFS transporter [unclassified Sphingopyxis]KTE26616.1 alpha-ketoglutarate permease [Sphingopyxis sp. H057]KTE53022.1 alpha-ketoglutarate permease [Sphingopyxis sp. H073]KTE55211.1 alpha-ketoglutarate permease [Sphingopyxis sp. H071]KTE58701.1 alpha-ketoglutarate permease [Sphingopyxis sp. H107]KTE61297.1 alpha-ketoglutarate permease [Sphingopyxis sp. H100]